MAHQQEVAASANAPNLGIESRRLQALLEMLDDPDSDGQSAQGNLHLHVSAAGCQYVWTTLADIALAMKVPCAG
jgi:hypothetical protein